MELGEFSELVLSLSRHGRHCSRHDVQHRILEEIRPHIAFDAAWWGIGALGAEHALAYQSFLHHLPASFLDDWGKVAKSDRLAVDVHANPNVAILGRRQGHAEEMAEFRRRYGIDSAVSITVPDMASGLNLFISLYRGERHPRFGERERALLQLLMPHIVAAWCANWKEASRQTEAEGRILHALVSPEGVLLDADPAFSRRLLEEWPEWRGIQLPEPVRHVARSGKAYRGKQFEIHAAREKESGTATVWCIARTAALLSPQEESAARRYASGSSYKEIARQLNLSPSTVRSYLRDCYTKLGVRNKYELGTAIDIRSHAVTLAASDPPGPPNELADTP